jgi:hypothetical protein
MNNFTHFFQFILAIVLLVKMVEAVWIPKTLSSVIVQTSMKEIRVKEEVCSLQQNNYNIANNLFVFLTINFFWDRFVLRSANMNKWICPLHLSSQAIPLAVAWIIILHKFICFSWSLRSQSMFEWRWMFEWFVRIYNLLHLFRWIWRRYLSG